MRLGRVEIIVEVEGMAGGAGSSIGRGGMSEHGGIVQHRFAGQRARAEIRALLGRALCIRQVDAGSCNGCELEIHAVHNPYYNLEGLGIRFVASPRHADMLLVTGPVAKNMENALKIAYAATPDPKLVAAIDAVLSGKPLNSDQKASVGCSIKWKPGNEPDYS